MKFSVNRAHLSRTLSLAARVLPRKAVNPIHNNFLLWVENGELLIRSTDADQSFEARIPVESKDEFYLLVNGNLLTQLVGRVEDETLKFKISGTNFVLERKKGNIQLRVTDAANFPNCPDIKKASDFVTFETAHLRRAFQGALLGTVEDKIITLNFVNFAEMKINQTEFKMLSTDRNRLSVINGKCKTKNKNPFDLQIPIAAMRILLPSMVMLENEYKTVFIAQNDNHLFFQFGKDFHYAFRKMSTTFPDLSIFFSSMKFDRTISVEAETLMQSLETVNILSDERSKSVRCAFAGSTIVLSAQKVDSGEIEEEIKADGLIEPFEAIYALDYVIPIIRRLDGKINLNFAEHKQKNADGSEFINWVFQINSVSNGLTENYYIQSKRF